MAKNYYQDLGITRQASAEDIKKAYRKLARKYHPDVSKEDDAEAQMQAINVAYDTLSDPEKKKQYDFALDHPELQQNNAEYSGFRQQSGQASDFSGFEDLFGRFGRGFGGGSYQQHRAHTQADSAQSQYRFRGEDQHARIEVEIDIAFQGATQNITLQIPTYNVHGEPEVQRKTLQVNIPKGMKEGQQIRLAKQGQMGINGGEPGDLYIEIHYRQNQHLRVEQADIYYSIDVTPWEAALGQPIEINTPSGTVNVNLPKNSTDGAQLRLKDRGIPAQVAGHLYLILNIVYPKVDTEQQQHAYEQFAQAFSHFNPRSHTRSH